MPLQNKYYEHLKNSNKFRNPLRSTTLQRNILEKLSSTDDTGVLEKCFETLALYILSNPESAEVIVKFKPLFDKIALLLHKRLPPTKRQVALNLITSLMYIDIGERHGRRRSLKMYAQNMIRVSGCLSTLCDLFLDCMMPQETWRALCQSLSETCGGSALNQAHCSHLVPVCVQRCQRGDSEAAAVLQSLLHGHQRHVLMFYQCEGMSMFTRESLQFTSYLQTLNAVIQGTRPAQRRYVLGAEGLFSHLRRCADTGSSASPVTRWAAIVISSRQTLLGINPEPNKNNNEDTIENTPQTLLDLPTDINENINSDTYYVFKNVISKNMEWNTLEVIQSRNSSYINNDVHREAAEDSRLELLGYDYFQNGRNFNRLNMSNLKATDMELSFSFLLEPFNSRDVKINDRDLRQSHYLLDESDKDFVPRKCGNDARNDGTVTRRLMSPVAVTQSNEMTPSIEFQPLSASTPKTNRNVNKQRPYYKCSPISKRSSYFRREQSVGRIKRHSPVKSDVKNRTIGAKFMDLFNSSCATLAQSISKLKNVFIPKVQKLENDEEEVAECSYRFTKYMRMRDVRAAERRDRTAAVYDATWTNFSRSSERTPCRTCNDTLLLKYKLTKDPTLKNCVKRLKMGINLYGCDFKKIRRVLWAREPSVTAHALYTIYRKLIAK